MGRVVAIAGGDLQSTKQLNLHAIDLTKKSNPNVLFIGTASNDAQGYIDNISKAYTALGCEIKSLCLVSNPCSKEKINRALSWADIIYVGGGDTISMMKIWKQYGLDKKLIEIYQKDSAVLTGISAGAICWFACGHSDSESFHQKDWHFCWADGMLDIFHMAYCPHYNEEGRSSFDEMLKDKGLTGLAMENDTAFVEHNEKQYFIRSNPNATGYIIQYENNVVKKQEVSFQNL